MATLTWVFTGDKDKAKAYAGEALRKRALLQNAHMRIDTWYSPVYTMPDGTTIRMQSVFGQDKIWIHSFVSSSDIDSEMEHSHIVFGGGWSFRPYREIGISPGGKPLWSVTSMTDGSYQGTVRSIKIAGNKVYSVGTASYDRSSYVETISFVECRNVNSGELIWRQIAPAGKGYARLFPDPDGIHLWIGGNTFIPDQITWNKNPWLLEKWNIKDGSKVWEMSAPSVDDGRCYDLVASGDNIYMAIEAVYLSGWLSTPKLIQVNKESQAITVLREYTASYNFGINRLATDPRGKAVYFTEYLSNNSGNWQGTITKLGGWSILWDSAGQFGPITTDGLSVFTVYHRPHGGGGAEAGDDIYSLKATTGETKWTYYSPTAAIGEIAVNDEGIYATGATAPFHFLVEKYSKSKGNLLWRYVDDIPFDIAYTIDAITIKDK